MKLIYGIVGVLAAIAAIAGGFLGMSDVLIVSALLAALLLIAANSDRIAKIRATTGGFEAETRAIIDEARATIEQLRAVGKLAVHASLSLVMRAGRWGGFSYEEKEAVRKASDAALDHLAVTAEERAEIFREWHTVTRFDYVHMLLGRHTVPKQVLNNPELHKRWSTLRDGGFQQIPLLEELQRFLTDAGMLDADRQELLEDYRFYEAKRRHRRPDVWKALVDSEK